MSDAVSLAAEIVARRFATDDGRFGVLVAVTADGDEITLVGPVGHLDRDDAVTVTGRWREHPEYGRQLEVEQIVQTEPTGAEGVRRILTAIKHVGDRGARWLLEAHGDDVLEELDADPRAVLREVPGIGSGRLPAAVDSWREQSATRTLRLLLAEHGVPAAEATRVVTALGPGGLDQLALDPYLPLTVDGIGFGTADLVARALGVAADAPQRIDAGLVTTLLAAANGDGHCYLTRSALTDHAAELLGLDAAVVAAGLGASSVVLDGGRALAPEIDALERSLAGQIAELAAAAPVLDLDLPDDPPTEGDAPPTADQWAAVRQAAGHRLSILTGLPGTGKTQTVRALVERARDAGREVALCAPTGKAARRLSELTGAPASTIHRLLAYQPGVGFTRDAEDPLTGIDLLVVDEASMLDLRLAAALFSAVGTRSHVLLVGDTSQLAPIGPGRILGDLLDSGLVPHVTLTEVFRQAARSLTVQAAHAIDRGERPRTRATDDELRDFFLIERPTATAVFDEAISLAGTRLAGHYGLDAARDIQVLSGIRAGPAGIERLNERLRELRNDAGEPIRGSRLRIGDRVMQTVNDHEREFYNGEIGFVVSAEGGDLIVACDDGRRLRIPASESGSLALAYACSVHKMQGSQAPAVVVAVARGHQRVLTRNLLYTAVTRSQRVCVVVAEAGAIEPALARRDATNRATRLVELVRAEV